MANNKVGLSYYSVDTDRYMDIRIKRLKKDYGCRGLAVYDYILCEVYRVRGCFTEWDESTAFDVAEYLGLKESNVAEIVKYCGVVGLFDEELLSRGIITSASIQRRYLEMCSRAKRKNIKIPEVCHIIPEESGIIPEVCRKVKKSKVKNITSISTGVENTGVVAEDILPDPVEDQNACAREKKAETIDPAHKAEFDRSAAEFDNPAIEAEIVDPAKSAVSHKTWKEDYETYLSELRKAYKTLLRDDAWISTQQRYNPNLNIPLTLEKACTTFWATEAGWQHKKRQRAKTIDWRRTLTNSISQPQNKVYNDNRTRTATTPSGGVSNDFKRSLLETLLGSGSAT